MKTTKSNFTTDWRGLTPYEAALRIQAQTWQKRCAGAIGDILLGFEHPAVITLGSRATLVEDVVGAGSEIPRIMTDRGGQATLHSPGQLVIYPIFDLRARGISVREFVGALQQATQDLLADFGIAATPAPGAGLMTERGKIAFIGLRIERGVTRHGLSLNLSNELSLFQGIRSCGVLAARLDRWADHGVEVPPMPRVFELWAEHFARILATEKPHKAIEFVASPC